MKNYTDYLDDISTFYVDPSTLSNQAALLANQYNGPEEQASSFAAGQIRGNPSNFDDIFMLRILVLVRLYLVKIIFTMLII